MTEVPGDYDESAGYYIPFLLKENPCKDYTLLLYSGVLFQLYRHYIFRLYHCFILLSGIVWV